MSLSTEGRFREVYRSQAWASEQKQIGSRSHLPQHGEIGRQLPRLLKDLDVRSMLDVPCGDFHWMREIDLNLDRYIGADVVEELIAANQKIDTGKSAIYFTKLDLISDPLPEVDLVFCRDCLVHFSFIDIRAALDNIVSGGSTWLLTTTFPSRRRNTDIVTGEWRPLNLECEPFHLPPPVRLLNEYCRTDGGRYGDKSLGLWKVADLGPNDSHPDASE